MSESFFVSRSWSARSTFSILVSMSASGAAATISPVSSFASTVVLKAIWSSSLTSHWQPRLTLISISAFSVSICAIAFACFCLFIGSSIDFHNVTVETRDCSVATPTRSRSS